MADNSERVSRLHAAAQGTKYAEDILGMTDPDDIYRFARDFTRNTMFGYRTVDRPTLFRGATGSSFGLFKNWVTHQMFWSARYAGDIGQGGGSALLMMNALTGLVGGIGATHAGAFARGLSSLVSTPDQHKELYNENDPLTDAFLYGTPAFLGFTLQGNSALPGSNPARDITQMFSFANIQQGRLIADSIGGGLRHWQLTGQAPWEDRQWRHKAVRATGIKPLYRTFQATGQDGIRSLSTGNPIIKEMSMGDKLLFGLGLNPTELTKEYQLNQRVRSAQDARSERGAIFGRQLQQAINAGDHREAFEIHQRAIIAGIPSDSLERSVKARDRNDSKGLAERAARNPDVRARFFGTPDGSE